MTLVQCGRSPGSIFCGVDLLGFDPLAMALAARLGELDEDVGRRLGQGMDLRLLAGIGLGAHGRAQAAGIDEVDLDRS